MILPLPETDVLPHRVRGPAPMNTECAIGVIRRLRSFNLITLLTVIENCNEAVSIKETSRRSRSRNINVRQEKSRPCYDSFNGAANDRTKQRGKSLESQLKSRMLSPHLRMASRRRPQHALSQSREAASRRLKWRHSSLSGQWGIDTAPSRSMVRVWR